MSSWSGSDLIRKRNKGVEPIYQDGFPPKGYLSHPTDPRPTFAWVVEETAEGSQGIYAYFPTEELARQFDRKLKEGNDAATVGVGATATSGMRQPRPYPYQTKITKKEIDDGKFWVKISKNRVKQGRKWVNDYRIDIIKDYDELKKTVESENKNIVDLDKIVYGELIDENWVNNPFYKAQIKESRADKQKETHQYYGDTTERSIKFPMRQREKYTSNPIHFDSIDTAHRLIPRPKWNGFKEEGGPFIHYNVGFSNEEVKVYTAFDYDEEHIDSFEESLAEGNISAGELFENGYSEIYDELGEKTGQRLVFTIPQLFGGNWNKMADNLDRRGNGEQVLDLIDPSDNSGLANTGITASPNKRYGDYIEDLVGSGWYIERTPEFALENDLTYKYKIGSNEFVKPYLIQRLGGVGGRSYPRPRIASIENPQPNFVDLGYGSFRIPDVGELTDIAFAQRANPDDAYDYFVRNNGKEEDIVFIPRRFGSEDYLRIQKDAIGVIPDISDWAKSKGQHAWVVEQPNDMTETYRLKKNPKADVFVFNEGWYNIGKNHFVRKIGDDYYSNTKAKYIWKDKSSARKAAEWNRRNGIRTRTVKVKDGYANLAKIPKEVIDEIRFNHQKNNQPFTNSYSITDYIKATVKSQNIEQRGRGANAFQKYKSQYKNDIDKIMNSTRNYFKEKYPSCVVNASESSGISKDKLLASFKRGVGAAKTNPQSIRNKFTGEKRPGGWPPSQRYSPKAWGCARAKKLARLGTKAGYDQDILRGD